MRFFRIDWSSDATWILIGMFFTLLLIVVLMERVSPRRKRNRARKAKSIAAMARSGQRDNLI